MNTTSRPASLTDRSNEETRAFYQERITRYLLICWLLGLGFVLQRVGVAVFSHALSAEVGRPDFIAHVVGVAAACTGWLLVRRGKTSVDHLERVETTALLVSMSAYATMGFFMPLGLGPQGVTMLALAMGLFTRAIYVPSPARRTLYLAVAVALPHLVLNVYAPLYVSPDPAVNVANEQFVAMLAEFFGNEPSVSRLAILNGVGGLLWWACTILLTTGASKVIYDLREEVRDVKKLGQYHLESKIGEGGMGIVHRASHAMLQRPTAIKLLPTDRVGEKSLARFEREVKITAKLTHPNTVTIFDYGRTPDGVFYYAMELLDGATLDEVVEQGGRLPPARVIHVLRQVCGSLIEAHGVDLIHRDIKPANIMLCERGGIPDTVKVLDFGLVKELKKSEDGISLTQAGVVTGTPQYMPPESLKTPDLVDARSDLYSLGAMAFLLLTGEDLFHGGTMVEVCSHHLHTAPRRPSEVVDDVPADLDDLVMACLAKDPAERIQSARALDEALGACACAGEWTTADAEAWWAARG